ncbi:MAG: hypothetical protein HQK96_04330 [Nitrospirae bacterium]|nr:hypothetical protein [Nitrospirota bacterium]
MIEIKKATIQHSKECTREGLRDTPHFKYETSNISMLCENRASVEVMRKQYAYCDDVKVFLVLYEKPEKITSAEAYMCLHNKGRVRKITWPESKFLFVPKDYHNIKMLDKPIYLSDNGKESLYAFVVNESEYVVA